MTASSAAWRLRRTSLLLFLILVAGSNSRTWAASVCNGGDFCDVPLMKFTFPGTHNSGSFDLDGPSAAGSDIAATAALCYYRNHKIGYKDQLNYGVRFFNIDLCDKEGEDGYYNCHSPGLDDTMAAFGNQFDESLDEIKAWSLENKNDVVLLMPSDFNLNSVTNNRASWNTVWNDLVTNDPLACVSFSWDLPAKGSDEFGCIMLDYSLPPDTLTLGWLVDKGYTVVIVPVYNSAILDDTWTGDYAGMTPTELFSYHEEVVAEAKEWGEMVYVFSFFRSQKSPDFESLDDCSWWDCITDTISALQEMQLGCNSYLADGTNNHIFPAEDRSDEDGGRYFISQSDGCDGSCCTGYRSELEIMHSKMLDRNSSIWSILVDFTNYGDLVGTVQRMNEMTVRRMKGELEPGESWVSCNTGAFVAIVVCSSLALILLILGILLWTGLLRKCWRRHCCCKEFCCPSRRNRRRKKDRYGDDMESQQFTGAGAGYPVGMAQPQPAGGVMYVNNGQPAQMNVMLVQQQQVPVATGGVYYQQNMQVQGGQALAPQSAYGMPQAQAQPQMVGAGNATFPARWQTE